MRRRYRDTALPFPAFTNLPEDLHVFSYRHRTWALPQFAANDCSTPWLLFDDRADALVISPMSHFMVASMLGDGRQWVASGFNPHLRNLPAGFTQQMLMAFGHGINATWDLWGKTLTGLEGVKRPGNEADAVLKYLGYWTDHGAYYYYNYDTNQTYAGTLILTNTMGTLASAISTVQLTNSTLRLRVNGQSPFTNVVAVNLTAGGMNQIRIDSITNVNGLTTFHLVSYATFSGSVSANFTLTPLPANYTGALVSNSTNCTIDLILAPYASVRPRFSAISRRGTNLLFAGTDGLGGRPTTCLPAPTWSCH